MHQLKLDLFQPASLPRKPYCTDDLTMGLLIRPLKIAIRMRYIQPNRPGMISYLAFDIDRPDAGIAWMDSNAPRPNIIIKNPENCHAHYLYALEAPVCTTSAAKMEPLRYLSAIERAISAELRADAGYSGLIIKNPSHQHWQTIEVENRAYSLERLASGLDLSTPANNQPISADAAGLGRNCWIFEELRHWSYRAVSGYWRPNGEASWCDAVRDRAHGFNDFREPLQSKEVDQIAKSVANWVWKRFSPAGRRALIARTHTPELQSERGRLKGAALRERGLSLLRAGLTAAQVAEITGASRRTVSNWMNRIVENDSHNGKKPISDNSPC